jgi:hypothetical protein
MRAAGPSATYWLALIGLVLATACNSGGGGGGCPPEGCEPAEFDPARGRFGSAVSVSGEVIAAGAALDDPGGGSSGSVFVFRFDGTEWVDEQRVVASDGDDGDFFGVAVSVSDDAMVVGAHFDDAAGQDSGSAYVYRFDGTEWVEEQKLVPSDAAAGNTFGASVAISGDLIVVGARSNINSINACPPPPGQPMPPPTNSDTGAAYVFRFDGTSWVEEQKLFATRDCSNMNRNDNPAGDAFGAAVSVSDDRILVGAEGDNTFAPGSVTTLVGNTGSAYVYTFVGATWVQQGTKLLATDRAASDQFGAAVSTAGTLVVVGAKSDDLGAVVDAGSAYVFGFGGTNWTQQQKLTAGFDAGASDFLGSSVSVSGSGDLIVLGAYLDDDAGPGSNSGSAYVFLFGGATFALDQKLLAADAAASDLFGIGVSTTDDAIVVGNPNDDDLGQDSGSASVRAFNGTDWFEEQQLHAFDPGDV